MSKYANLPDIDTAPDTYQIDSPPLSPTISNQHESSNRQQEENQQQQQSQSSSSNNNPSATIQTDPINSKAATNSFRKATQLREQDTLDYSDSIQPRPKRSHQSSSNKIPNLPPIYGSESDLYSTDPNLDSIPFDPYNPLHHHSRSINESPTEKLLRLKRETDLLEKELSDSGEKKVQDPVQIQGEENQSAPTGSQSTTKLLSQLKYLQNRLNGVSFSSIVAEDEEKSRNWQKEANDILQDLNSNSISISENNRHQGLKNGDGEGDGLQKVNRTRDLTLLDGRISEMEDLVGVKQVLTGVDESSPLPRPLLPTLSKLEHQLLLLTQPRHLDAISRRVKVLASELNRVHEARKKLGEEMVLTSTNTNNTSTNLNPTNNSSSSSTNTNNNPSSDPNSNPNSLLSDPSTLSRLNSLSKLQPRLESLLPIAPTILSRLKSLSNLHESSNDFHTNLDRLENSFKNQSGRMKEIENVLKNVEESLKENREMVEGNLKGLEERLEGLGKRLKDL